MTVSIPDDLPVYVGQRITLEIEFRLFGVPTDPTIVQVTSKDPMTGSSTVITYPDELLTRTDVGQYEASVQVATPGQWHFRTEAAGIVDAVTEAYLDVQPTSVGS